MISLSVNNNFNFPTGTKILYNGTHLIPDNSNDNVTSGATSSGIPQVIAFTSVNGGDPGVNEPINNLETVQKAKVGLTLLRIDDMDQLINLANQTDHVSITSGIITSFYIILYSANCTPPPLLIYARSMHFM